MEYTVMSYRSYVGASTTSGYRNESGGYAQSLMMYDIAAVQHMYGANFTTHNGATTYSWSATTGEMFVNGVGQGAPIANRVFQTVWDGGGIDTYDFSNYATNLKIDLRPGEWTTTSTAQLARLHWDGSKLAAGNIANALLYEGDLRSLIENAIGGSGNDTIKGNQAANVLRGGAGIDFLDGGAALDAAIYSEKTAAISVTLKGSTPVRVVVGGVAEDTILNIESITGGSGSDRLVGDAFANTLVGGAGRDSIFGMAGNDILDGGTDNDVLTGGLGRDFMTGGTGADRFDFNSITEIGNGATCDIITAFTHLADDIDLSTIDASSLLSGNNAFVFRGTAGFTTSASGELRVMRFDNAGTTNDYTIVCGDMDADIASEFQIHLKGLVTLTAADFLL
jgi:serralysin